MSRRTKIIIAFVIIVAFLLWIFGILMGSRGEKPGTVSSSSPPSVSLPTTSSTPSRITAPLGIVEVPGEAEAPKSVTDVLAFARSFIERYGSFSSQSNFENMEALYPFMTNAFSEATAAYIAIQRRAQGQRNYQGTTTRALSAKVSAGEGTEARTILVKTQRQESTEGQVNARLYYQDAELVIKQIGSQWKVDRVEWK